MLFWARFQWFTSRASELSVQTLSRMLAVRFCAGRLITSGEPAGDRQHKIAMAVCSGVPGLVGQTERSVHCHLPHGSPLRDRPLRPVRAMAA